MILTIILTISSTERSLGRLLLFSFSAEKFVWRAEALRTEDDMEDDVTGEEEGDAEVRAEGDKGGVMASCVVAPEVDPLSLDCT